MIYVVATTQVKPEQRDAFIKGARECIAETRKEKGCLAYESHTSINDSNLFVRFDIKINSLEYKVQSFSIASAVIVEVHGARSRPTDWWSISVNHLRGLARKSGILKNAFHRDDIRLNLHSLTNNPIQRLGDLKSIRHCQADSTGR